MTLTFYDKILQRIGIPIHGVLHFGQQTQEFDNTYTFIFGLTQHEYKYFEITSHDSKDITSTLYDNNVNMLHYNFITVENISCLSGDMTDILKHVNYIHVQNHQDIDDILGKYEFHRVVIVDNNMFYRKKVMVYRYLPNSTLRLGNVIHMLIHLLYYADKTSSYIYFHFNPHEMFQGMFNTLFYPCYGVRKFDRKTANLNRLEKHTTCLQIISYPFYFNCPMLPTERDRRYIAQKYISQYLPSPDSISDDNSTSSHLTIHIRSGDIFSNTQHTQYLQPPLAYYIYIIEHYEYKNITVITEPDKTNPVINKLLERYPHIQCLEQNFKDDIRCILSATDLVVGTGSFAQMLSLCSRRLRRLYCFHHHNLYYRHADYEIVVLGIDSIKSGKPYPKRWENDVNILIDDAWVMKEYDMIGFREEMKNYWDELLIDG